MASAGGSTGWIWRATPTPTASSSTIRPDAWRYRDWVIDASIAICPTTISSACSSPATSSQPDDPAAFIATGFNRCYPDMVDLNDQGDSAECTQRHDRYDGQVFLGLSIACARCHDHKFDPIRQTDFYRLQAFFTPAGFATTTR